MIIKKIDLKHYRNIRQITFVPDPHMNVIYGENAQGKTNLLESIYLFSGGRSFRGCKDQELVAMMKKKEDQTEVAVDFSTQYDTYCGKIKVQENRLAFLNEVPLKTPRQLGDKFPVMLFAPRDLALTQNAPADRRKFLDLGLFQLKSSYGEVLKKYRKLLEQRKAVLSQIKNDKNNPVSLEIWDEALSVCGAQIMYQRQQYLNRLTKHVLSFFSGLSGKNETLEFHLVYSAQTESHDQAELAKAMIEGLKKEREKDIRLLTTSVGPHKDDLKITINGLPVKNFGSQGQQRSVALAMKMGEACVLEEVYGEPPVVLLDDVMSELDQTRQNYILNHIEQFQVFITCCDKDTVLRLQEGKTFHLSDGALLA